MKPETLNCMNEMVQFAREGNDVIPMFFQRSNGLATVSAAVRCAKKRGLLVQNGVDGVGNPCYTVPLPTVTHATTGTVQ